MICHSDAVVRHVQTDGDDLLIGLQIKKASSIYRRCMNGKPAIVLRRAAIKAERVADASKILPQFKEWVSDLRNYLERMKAFLDQEESALESEDLFTRDQIVAQYLGEVGPRIIQRVQTAKPSNGRHART